jgi:hypothetical protein
MRTVQFFMASSDVYNTYMNNRLALKAVLERTADQLGLLPSCTVVGVVWVMTGSDWGLGVGSTQCYLRLFVVCGASTRISYHQLGFFHRF